MLPASLRFGVVQRPHKRLEFKETKRATLLA